MNQSRPVSTEESLSRFLDSYLDAYFTRRDFDATVAWLSPAFSCVGSGLGELAEDLEAGFASYRRDLTDAPQSVDYVFRHRQIRALAPNMGLILLEMDIETDVQGKLLVMHHLRLTMTVAAPIDALTDTGMPADAWRIEQKHVSMPNSEQDEDEAYPVKELKERNAVLEKLTAELTRAEQRERTRIAGILHDNLQQLLVGARLGVEQGQRRLRRSSGTSGGETGAGEALDRVMGLLREAQQVMRDLVADLSPPILREAGLTAALHWLARVMLERYQQEVDIHVETDMSPRQPEVRDILFDGVRECLFNAVKHAHARHAEVRVQQEGGWLRVTISNCGDGFDVDRALNAGWGMSGYGLIGIRERLALLGGRLSIVSRQGEGTEVCLAVLGCSATSVAPSHPRAGGLLAQPAARQAVGLDVPSLRVLLVDDHPMVRNGLAALLSDQPDIEVVGEAASGEEALIDVARLQPDLVIMDASMPGMGGIEATRRISQRWPEVRVIGLSMHAEADRAAAMQAAGACDYQSKTGDVDALLAVIRRQFDRG
ncbi:response regulator [Thiorhodovibrio frisius]|uniref:Response regulator receiver domain protein,histidine kinase n=1 Tax=Thiorhodovibrio frisius TaxID=631362 RepID=H8Z3B8_9GAMM|nr:response regulator [Thiorhodovibrio frisius]EIC21826.1 Response regulator receiver domain protein,histidine kinase [Thiorhodovibrio frisius]WPL21794.1 Transcriptional regulatory protein LiaR [Thiorhodovibrio frisius]